MENLAPKLIIQPWCCTWGWLKPTMCLGPSAAARWFWAGTGGFDPWIDPRAPGWGPAAGWLLCMQTSEIRWERKASALVEYHATKPPAVMAFERAMGSCALAGAGLVWFLNHSPPTMVIQSHPCHSSSVGSSQLIMAPQDI